MRYSHMLLGIGLCISMTPKTSRAADLAGDWSTLSSSIPMDALALGKDTDGNPLYACRAMFNGNGNNLQVGKTSSAFGGVCNISYGGSEYSLGNAQILMVNWANPASNAVPLASINGQQLYACRGISQVDNGALLLGWALSANSGCVSGA